MAVSMFFLWTIGAMGSRSAWYDSWLRDTPTLRRSLFMIGFFYALIYFPCHYLRVCPGALGDQYVNQSDKIIRSWP